MDALTGEQLFIDEFVHDTDVSPAAVAGEEILIASGGQILSFSLATHTLSDSGYVPSMQGVEESFFEVIYDSVAILDSGDIIAVMKSDGWAGPQLHWARYADAPEPVWRTDFDNMFGTIEAATPTTLLADEGPFYVISGMFYAYSGFGGLWMPAPGSQRFDSATGEWIDSVFGEFESNEAYAHAFGCMSFIEDDILATVTSLFPSPAGVGNPEPPYLGLLQRWSPQGDLLSTQVLAGGGCDFDLHPDIGNYLTVVFRDENADIYSQVHRLEPDGSTVQVVEDTLRPFADLAVNADHSLAILQHAPATICRIELD